jgi:hypothetical protein
MKRYLAIFTLVFFLAIGSGYAVESALTIEVVDITGWNLTDNLTAANADGNYWTNSDQDTYLVAVNGSGGAIVITITAQQTLQGGNVSITSPTVSVGAGKTYIIGPFSRTIFNDATGIHVTYDGVTSLTVAAVQITNL